MSCGADWGDEQLDDPPDEESPPEPDPYFRYGRLVRDLPDIAAYQPA